MNYEKLLKHALFLTPAIIVVLLMLALGCFDTAVKQHQTPHLRGSLAACVVTAPAAHSACIPLDPDGIDGGVEINPTDDTPDPPVPA